MIIITYGKTDRGHSSKPSTDIAGAQLKYAKRFAFMAGISFVGINLAANAEVSGVPLYHAYVAERTDNENYLSQRLSHLGRSVTVNCLPLYDMHGNQRSNTIVAEGYVVSFALFAVKDKVPHYILPIITMNDTDCAEASTALHDAERHRYASSLNGSVSLGRLTHEFEHIDGDSGNEPLTECHNTQRFESRLEALGYPSEVASAMSWLYAGSHYRLKSYLSPECKPGGAMDLHINGDFPLLHRHLPLDTN